MTPAIDLLQKIHSSYERMWQMAEGLKWDEITAEWDATEKLMVNLTKVHLTSLVGTDRVKAADLIEKILALQEKITARVKPWQEQVRPLLESFKRYPLKIKLEAKSAG